MAATEHILAADPVARVLILTTYETDADILRAVEAGATGYLLKDATAAELAGAVRAAARGETVLAPSVAERLISHVRRPPRESLSARETEVLAQVARGRTNAEIGQALFISEATVKTHLLRAFGKLGGVRPHRGGDHRYRAGPSPPSGREPVTAATTRAVSVRSGRTTCAPAAVRSAAG